jgi:hypothetical protein
LSYHIKIDKEDGIVWIQLNSINKSKEKFGEESMAMQGHGTPGTPQFNILRPNNEEKFRLLVTLNIGPAL